MSGTTTTHNEIITSTSNRLSSVQNAGGTTTRSFAWRGGGDMSADSTVGAAAYTYNYDARKRLSQVLLNGVEAGTYGYDYLDRQVWRSIDGGAQSQYVDDEDDHLLAEYNGATGALVKEYVWLDDLPVAMIDSSSGVAKTYYVTAGRLNEPQQLIDSTGAVAWNAYVTPWGTAQTFTTPTETIDLLDRGHDGCVRCPLAALPCAL